MDVVDVTKHRGEADITVGDEARRTGPGGLVMIPAGVRHHVRNPGRCPTTST